MGIGLFIFSLILRLWRFPDIEFKLDEALAVFKASQFWFTGKFPLFGLVSSTGAANPPLFLYLLLIPTLISKNPLFITFFFALAGSLTIVIFYQVLKKYFSEKLAFFSSMLFATSAWPIIFSRKIWAQNLLPLFSALILYYSLELLNKKKQSVAPLIILGLWVVQIHLSGILVLPFFLAVLLASFFKKRKMIAKEVALGIFLGLLPLIPYLIFQAKDQFRNFSLLFSGRSGALPFYDFHNFTSPFRITAGFYFSRVLGAHYPEFVKTLPFSKFIFTIFNFQTILAFLGFIFCLLLGKKFRVLALFFGTIVITSFLSKRPAVPFYQELYFPLIFSFLGIGFWQIWQMKIVGKILSWLIFFFFLGANLIFIFHFYNFIHQKQQINGDYGLVFQEKEKLVQKAIRIYKYHPKEAQIATAARVYFSIFNYDKDKKEFLPQKDLLPVVNLELGDLSNF